MKAALTTAELRDAFDREFGEPYPAPARETLGLILLRISNRPYALPLDQITGIHAAPRVGAVPARGERRLVGLVTVRNVIVPVLDLAVALGARTGAAPGQWIVIGRGDAPIGWSFDVLDRQIRIEPPAGGLGPDLDVEGTSHRVIDLEELLHAA